MVITSENVSRKLDELEDSLQEIQKRIDGKLSKVKDLEFKVSELKDQLARELSDHAKSQGKPVKNVIIERLEDSYRQKQEKRQEEADELRTEINDLKTQEKKTKKVVAKLNKVKRRMHNIEDRAKYWYDEASKLIM